LPSSVLNGQDICAFVLFFLLLEIAGVYNRSIRATVLETQGSNCACASLGCGLPRTVRARTARSALRNHTRCAWMLLSSSAGPRPENRKKSPTQGSLCKLPRSGAIHEDPEATLQPDGGRDLRLMFCTCVCTPYYRSFGHSDVDRLEV
jgi:hypothetical protein